jgi:predicted enzyme related to lactoylglutathione lyase
LKPSIGSIGWADLTVDDAGSIRDFYQAVIGWKADGCDMGAYEDYVMAQPETGTPTSGICWRRGGNAHLPPVWLVYITVTDLNATLAAVRERGGTVLADPSSAGEHVSFAVTQDPAGATCALHQAPAES